ncbi:MULTISPECIES: sulfite dehydrogenase [Paraburkholderia]|uniref:sulfite dehydrogenase n=1 Tax=Paraburkholderia TaxID=1822464 RepID=UPI0022520FB8|nr:MULTISPECIES: sulfite dehydrogenase [Paraburkholderia]MCX4165992.1 sulfite dehydrogenase [Paraburkholderia megapolitana]MDN7161483.1 sulfite dehydrogenase [Paraburkholderia sp. CHISQ3]MDQ6498530.1 sulfite dehydrogenase [Paraburkholderia megapolitana]
MTKIRNTSPNPPTSRGRRRLLGGLAASGLIAARRAGAASPTLAPLEIAPWSRTPGAPILEHPYGLPSPHESEVVRRSARTWPLPGAASSMTPLADLYGTITPNGLVYERHHGGVPDIDPDRHRLAIHGLVREPKLFTMDDLVRLPSESRIHFIECSGNTGSEWNGPSGQPVQLTHGLLSCCEWTGVRLSTLLEEVGGLSTPNGARGGWMLAEGADAAAMTRSLPLERILDRALVVYAQNGERLRPENGYPLRLIVPGFEGNTNVKWLRRLKFVDAPLETREETSKYTSLMADGTARQFAFEMDAKSVITRPSPGHRLTAQGYYPISGLAWSGRGAIRKVEVSTDAGATWQLARLDGTPRDRALTRFQADWLWQGAPAVILSRATDSTGYVQPTREALVAARGLNSQYHYNAIQQWRIDASGEVRNA